MNIKFGPRATHIIGSPDDVSTLLLAAAEGYKSKAACYDNGDELGMNAFYHRKADEVLELGLQIEDEALEHQRGKGY